VEKFNGSQGRIRRSKNLEGGRIWIISFFGKNYKRKRVDSFDSTKRNRNDHRGKSHLIKSDVF
jgi:hypothetical protein